MDEEYKKWARERSFYNGKAEFVPKRQGSRLATNVPPWAGHVVSMKEFKGVVLVACQNAVFRLDAKLGVLRPIMFQGGVGVDYVELQIMPERDVQSKTDGGEEAGD